MFILFSVVHSLKYIKLKGANYNLCILFVYYQKNIYQNLIQIDQDALSLYNILSKLLKPIRQSNQYHLLMQKNQMRIKKEFDDFAKTSEKSTVKVSIVNNDFKHWKGYIEGPDDTPYKGGFFQIDIALPPEYPYKPPKMKFETKIWHPNISSQTGAICLDILKDQWSPALTIRTALLSLQALLCAPQPNDPQDAVVAGQYKQNRQKFNKHAQEWVQKYASPQVNQGKIKKLMQMGFTRQQVQKALLKVGYDQQKALQELLSNA